MTAILMLSILSSEAQLIVKERKAVQLMPQQTFYLNSTARAAFGGKSRAGFNVVLPPNTVEWFYSFTTTKGEKPKTSVELFSQLTKLIDPTGMTAVATNAIFTVPGSGACDIYVMSKDNGGVFLERSSTTDMFDYDAASARENFQNGTVRLDNITKGEWTLGFRNRNATEGIAITIEVVAIVEDIKIIEKPLAETKAEVFAILARKAYDNEDYNMALQLYRKALQYNPNMVKVNSGLGLVNLMMGDYIAAIEAYSTVIAWAAKNRSSSELNEAVADLKALVDKHGDIQGAADILAMFVGQQNEIQNRKDSN